MLEHQSTQLILTLDILNLHISTSCQNYLGRLSLACVSLQHCHCSIVWLSTMEGTGLITTSDFCAHHLESFHYE